jgi:hypothetical protein
MLCRSAPLLIDRWAEGVTAVRLPLWDSARL